MTGVERTSRGLAILVLVGLWTALVAADAVPPSRKIDLDAPGALEALQKSRPAHFEKVEKILEGVSRQPDRDVPRWMRVSFGARAVSYSPTILTSFPPKQRLSFVLDDTLYEALVALTNGTPGIRPLQ